MWFYQLGHHQPYIAMQINHKDIVKVFYIDQYFRKHTIPIFTTTLFLLPNTSASLPSSAILQRIMGTYG